MAIYLHIDGIEGTVKAKGYQNWIELSSSTFSGVRTQVSTRTGKTQNRVLSLPHFGSFQFSKRSDKSSVKLFQAVHNAKVFPTVKLVYVSTGSSAKMYTQYKLGNALISAFQEYHDAESDFPEEFFEMNFETIEKTFVPRLADNTAASPLITGYNIETATEL